MNFQSQFKVKLFYSYSHKDSKHREKMVKSLTLLRELDGILSDWSDHQILPGQHISEKVKEQIKESDICVFLLSQDFVASEPCREEWSLAGEVPSLVRVPVILSECSWMDVEDMSQLKALPEDGKPIKNFRDRETAWQQVYEGLKVLIEGLRGTFTIRDDFREEVGRTDFLSQEHITLQDIFVFPAMSSSSGHENTTEKYIENTNELLKENYVLVHGERLSGKTALCRHILLTLVDRAVPVLYLDLETLGHRASPGIFSDAYRRQFHGDYLLWKKQDRKLIILDNLKRETIDHVNLAMECFEQVLVTVSTDTYFAYYRDDERVAKFQEIEILPLTHSKQEKLIRKRFELSSRGKPVLDGQIDEVENRVNSVIINNRILPRYPFYVLSILQTYEGFMPNDLSVTSYGHCYYVLIIAHFLKSGIVKSDDEINACLNFAEHLAFEIYRNGTEEYSIHRDLMDKFIKGYGEKYIPLKSATLNRLFDHDYGIVTESHQSGNPYQFRNPYMYYYFLGKHLANNCERHKDIIDGMIGKSYIPTNCLTLIFAIHHTNDDQIIEDIMLQTMCALEDIAPSVLDPNETDIYEDIVSAIPSQVLSQNSVKSERERERNDRDIQEHNGPHGREDTGDDESIGLVNDIYKIMTNNEILGQILKNKYGSLERGKIAEAIETIADGGLRLVRSFLGDQNEINQFAVFLHEQNPESDIEEIKQLIRLMSFFWTMHNVEKIVGALNKPEIRAVVEDVVAQKNTPSYELIEYFLRLDTIKKFSHRDRKKLKSLWNKHQYPFFRKVISIRTQRYLNTHHVSTSVEQAVCSILNVRYQTRLKKLG